MKMGNVSRWLDVEVGSSDIGLNTLPSNIALVDLHDDNEYKLLIGDLGRGMRGPELKVFRGAMQISDIVLPDLPLGVLGVYTNTSLPRTPIIVVAFSSCLYFFRNLRLFYKYYLPTIELNASELDAWKQLVEPSNHNTDSIEAITKNLSSIPSQLLSIQSRQFLKLSAEQQLEYLEQIPELPKQDPAEISCVTALKMSSVDRYAVSCIVVGTEDGEVVILDPHTFTPMSQAKLCTVKKTPCQIIATGMYTVGYRLTVATREKAVCLLKREWQEGRILFTTDEHIIAIEVVTSDSSVLVICADNTMACYSKKGKKQWSLTLEHRPVSMTSVPVMRLGTTLFAVGLASGHVYLYNAKAPRDAIFVRDIASVMKFGQLGQEEHVFIIITGSGNLSLKILKRTADFSAHAAGVEVAPSLPSGQKPWLIPKKSKLFIEQSARERENAIAMHEAFQQELTRLRLTAAKTLLDAHLKSDNSVGAGAMESIRLTAEVEGLGPVFRVTLVIGNTSPDKAVVALAILFHVHTINYKVSNPYFKIKGDLSARISSCIYICAILVQLLNFYWHSNEVTIESQRVSYNTFKSDWVDADWKLKKHLLLLAWTTQNRLVFRAGPYYEMSLATLISVPLLSPNATLRFPTKIEEVFDDNINPDVFFRPVTGQAGERSLVKILLLKEGRSSPVLAATVQMPPTDPMMLPFDKIQPDNTWNN